MRTWPFYRGSLLGMLSGTVARMNAGTELGQINGLHNVMSWELVGSLFLLALFPFPAKKLIDIFKQHKAQSQSEPR